MADSKNYILTKEAAAKKMERMALEIAGQLYDEKEPLIIIGIAGSGMVIAEHIANLLKPLITIPIQLITCTLNKKHPETISYSETIDFTGKNILLADDVTNSGRTLLYAMKPLLQYYPLRIQMLALVERMHKNFPVHINYIGLSIASTLEEHIQVDVIDGAVNGAYIE